MESIAEQISTKLRGGETPQQLIKKGFKRTTVYSVARKMKGGPQKDSGDQSLDRDIYLAHLMEYVFTWLIDGWKRDAYDEWQSIIEYAAKQFEEDTGRKPPEDILRIIRRKTAT